MRKVVKKELTDEQERVLEGADYSRFDQKREVKLVMKRLNFFTFLIFNFKILTKQTRKNSNDLERPRTTWNEKK